MRKNELSRLQWDFSDRINGWIVLEESKKSVRPISLWKYALETHRVNSNFTPVGENQNKGTIRFATSFGRKIDHEVFTK